VGLFEAEADDVLAGKDPRRFFENPTETRVRLAWGLPSMVDFVGDPTPVGGKSRGCFAAARATGNRGVWCSSRPRDSRRP
jgi:hypothetical protein